MNKNMFVRYNHVISNIYSSLTLFALNSIGGSSFPSGEFSDFLSEAGKDPVEK